MITVNIEKAKEIAHDIRRAKRDEEFAPLDKVVMLQLPNSDDVETQRQEIRDKYALIQSQIDKAKTVEKLLDVVTVIKE